MTLHIFARVRGGWTSVRNFEFGLGAALELFASVAERSFPDLAGLGSLELT